MTSDTNAAELICSSELDAFLEKAVAVTNEDDEGTTIYATMQTRNDDMTTKEEEEEATKSYWFWNHRNNKFWNSVVQYSYLPFLCIFQSVFGGCCLLLRTVWMGYIVQYVFSNTKQTSNTITKYNQNTNHLNNILQQASTSWPAPPALIGLALLTLITLLVHPDGYTWILLRKIRNGMLYLLQSSSTCWAMAVNDYGTIVSSILALSTFAALFFLAYVLHQTLTPRTPPQQQNSARNNNSAASSGGDTAKQKRKRQRGRRHNNHHRNSNNGGGGRIKQRPSSNKELVDPIKSSEKEYNNEKGGSTTQLLPPLAEDEPVVNHPAVPSSSTPTTARNNQATTTTTMADVLYPRFLSSANSSTTTNDEQLLLPPRSRSSTVDSGTNNSMFDDHSSCGTESGRSTPTPSIAIESSSPPSQPLPAAVTPDDRHSVALDPFGSSCSEPPTTPLRTKGTGNSVGGTGKQNHSSRGTSGNNLSRGRHSSNANHHRRGGGSKNSSKTLDAPSSNRPVVPSKRWDALKPTARTTTTAPAPAPASRQARSGMKQRRDEDFLPSQRASHNHPHDTENASRNKDRRYNSGNRKQAILRATSSSPSQTWKSAQQLQNAASFPSVSSDRLLSPASQQTQSLFGGSGDVLPTAATPTKDSEASARLTLGTPERLNAFASPVASSTLNPNSPSWKSQQNRASSVFAASSPIRPPPGLGPIAQESPLGSSTSTSSSPFGSPFGGNGGGGGIQHTIATSSSPFQPPSSTTASSSAEMCYQGLSALPPVGMLPFRPAADSSGHHRHHVKENPFAASDEEDQIEAELQELGGQMVGSILDF